MGPGPGGDLGAQVGPGPGDGPRPSGDPGPAGTQARGLGGDPGPAGSGPGKDPGPAVDSHFIVSVLSYIGVMCVVKVINEPVQVFLSDWADQNKHFGFLCCALIV